jgi:hypothetical protein
MTDPILQMYLLAFMLLATILIIFWEQFRKVTQTSKALANFDTIVKYSRLKRMSLIFLMIFSAFGVMTVIYSLLPEFYYLFIPLDVFHHPLINVIGLFIMKIAIVWIAVAQIHIDKELYKYSRNIESLSAMELVSYSEKMLLTGMLVLFVGFFTTITNFVGLILVGLGIAIYLKMFFSNQPEQFQN